MEKIAEKIIALAIWLITTLLAKTWRFTVVPPPSSDVNIFDKNAPPKIYCFWHSTLLVVAYLFRNTGKAAIVSRSKDGRIAAYAAKRWGHDIIFGSPKRGGMAALRQSVRAIKNGRSLGITPDGPKGPVNVVKQGAAQIATVSNTPLVTIKVAAENAWRLRSWDKFMIPKPFAKIVVTLSDEILPDEIILRDDNIMQNKTVLRDDVMSDKNIAHDDDVASYKNIVHDEVKSSDKNITHDNNAIIALTNLIQEKLL